MATLDLVRVHHWIACRDCKVVGPARPDNHYNLLSVGYVQVAPPDTEFPWVLRKLDLFARFVGGTGTRFFEVQIIWVDAPVRRRIVGTYGPMSVAFRPNDPVRDFMFRIRNVTFPGRGRYRIRLFQIQTESLSLRATEYIEVRHEQ